MVGHGKNPFRSSVLSQTSTLFGEYFRSTPRLSREQQSFTPQSALNPKKPIRSSPASIICFIRPVKSGSSRSNGIGSVWIPSAFIRSRKPVMRGWFGICTMFRCQTTTARRTPA